MENVQIRKLKNGITLITEKIAGMNTFSMGYFVNTGSINEYENESGISHFIEHMMFKGTEKRTATELSEAIDIEGGIINAYTSRDRTVYYVKLLSDKIDIAIDIMSDMFLNSTFSIENLEKERNVIIEEIRMYDDIPEEVVHDENIKFALTGIYSNSISGSVDSVKKITREDIMKYLKEQYKPSNIVISLSGDIDADYVYNSLDKIMGEFGDSKITREIDKNFKINSGINIIKRDTNQVHLCFNTRADGYPSKMRYAIEIISNVLAGGMSSRLFQKIREDRGLAYSVYSYTSLFQECGLLTIYAGTTKENYLEVIEIIKNELEDIKNNGITDFELQKTKNQFASYMIFNLESTKSRMSRLANSYLIYGEIKPIHKITEEIQNTSIDDIKEAAEFLFNSDYYSYTVLGDIE